MVPDARLDPRFAQNPLVVEEPYLRFYAGVPLLSPVGEAVGTLSVMDIVARELTEMQLNAIQVLADQVVNKLELRALTWNQGRSLAEPEQMQGQQTQDRQTQDQQPSPAPLLADENPQPLSTTVREIANQIEAEQALRESEKRFSRLFSSAATGITLSHVQGNFIQANPAFCTAVGYSEDELQSLDYLTITHPDDKALSAGMLQKLFAGEIDSFVLEKRYVTKGGGTVWVRASISCVCSDLNEPLYVIGVTEDITERVHAQSVALRLEQRLAMTLEHMTDAFCLLDTEWRVSYMNAEAERLTLHTSGQMRNLKLWERFPPTMSSALYTEFHRAVRDKEPVHFELFYPPLQNWFEVHAYPLPDGLAIYFRVITERKQAIEALQASEERFRQLAETIDDVFWIWDPREDRILYASPRYDAVFGHSREELYRNPRSFARDMHPEDYERLRSAALEDPYSVKLDYRLLLADGQVRWVSVRTFPVYDAVGNLRHSVGIAQDVTQLMETAEQLKASEQQYRLLFAHNPHPMWVYDKESLRFLAVNDQAVAHYGYTEEEFLAMTIHEIRPAEDIAKLDKKLAELTLRKGTGVWRHYKKDGTLIDVEVSSDAIVFGGRAARLVLANDITIRRRAEEKVREQAALLDKAQDAILVRDLDNRITYWNHGAERLYGWKAEEVIGSQPGDFLFRDPAQFDRAQQQLMVNGEWFGELQQIDRHGNALLVEARWTLVRDEDGAAQAVLSISTDITERRKLEAQFLRAQRMESIGTLAGGIAHDLNNVLAPILLSLGMLKRQSRTPAEQKLLGTLENSAQRGANMVRQVLTFARGVEGERVVVDVGQTVREVQDLLRETIDRRITFTANIAKNLLPILGDPTQIHQVVLNLCVNARDAMPNGGDLVVELTTDYLASPFASLHLVAEPGHYVVLRVYDNGIGIPAAIRERIFDPFFTTKELGQGTGLGLSTVQAVIKSHNGFINVYSEEGRGTEFKVYLPALGKNVTSDIASMLTAEMGNHEDELVLVVDDEPAIREITQLTLESFGFRVLTADGGAEALSLYAQHQAEIAIVLTDMMMPGMDGFEVIRHLLEMNPLAKIIAASGLTATDTVAKATSAGVSHFLQKPYTAEALLKIFAEIREEKHDMKP